MPTISRTSTPATKPTPKAVDAQWQAFFQSLKDERADVARSAARAVVEAAELAAAARGELVAALDGDWREVEKASATRSRRGRRPKGVELTAAEVQQATRDSIRALMLIRAYRARGHFHANLDPLGLEPHKDEEDLDPRSYGFTDADFDRKIFLDNVLGLEFATLARDPRDPAAHLLPDARRRVHAHLRPGAEGWMQERIEGPDKEISFTREGKRAILNKLIEAEGFEKFCDVKFTGTKRFGLDGGESMIPALEQIIKRGGALGVKEIVHRHGASRPAQRAGAGDGQAAPRDLPRVQGRLVDARRRSRAPAT